jgi:hypothetical protein
MTKIVKGGAAKVEQAARRKFLAESPVKSTKKGMAAIRRELYGFDPTVEAVDVTDSKHPRRIRLPDKLRYLSPENIAKDFPSKRERAAIAAVFSWLGLSGSCGRRLKHRTHIKVGCSSREFVREMSKEHDVVVWDMTTLERAAKILKTGYPWDTRLRKPWSK